MTWPASDVDTTDMDAGTDSPLSARSDLHDLATKFNLLRNHVSTFIQGLLDDTTATAARTTLGLGSAAVEPTTTFWSTGDAKLTFKTAADTGWILLNDGSIGNGSSGATTRANADTSALFTLIWTNISNTWAPTQTSAGAPVARGASAAADFSANRRLVLPKVLGRALAIAGSGASLTTRALGEILGTETHILTTSQMPAHTHPGSTSRANNTGTGLSNSAVAANVNDLTFVVEVNVASQGDGAAHPNMQPSSFLNVMVKL